MPNFSTEVPHTLGQEEAISRLKTFVDKVAERFQDQVKDMEGTWNDNQLDFSFSTYGFKIAGVVTVEDDVVRLEGQLPFAAVAFRGKIEQSIHSELERALS